MNGTRDIILYSPRKKQPVVVVNEDAITYNPPGLSVFTFNASILWPQIAAIYPDEIVRQRRGITVTTPYLAIVPRDVTAFLLSAYPLMKRVMVAATISSFGGPMTIVQNVLPISTEDLFLQITTQYRNKIDTYGIRTEKGSN